MPKAKGPVPRQQSPNGPSPQDINSFLSRFNVGDFAGASQIAHALTRKFPKHGLGWVALGILAKQAGRLQDALAAFRQAVKLDPRDSAAHSNLGVVLKALGRLGEAESSLRKAILLNPADGDTRYNLGNTLRELGRPNDAEQCFREAIRLLPDHADAHLNLGNALKERGRTEEAVKSYRDAIRCNPNLSSAHCNLGIVLNEIGRLRDAEQSFRTAIRINQDDAMAQNAIGFFLMGLGRLAEAEECFRRSLAIKPDYVSAWANLLFVLNYDPDKPAETIRAVYSEYDQRFGEPHRAAPLEHGNAPATGRRLKIGYVSPDFREHSSRFFLEPLLANHDRASFEIFAYAALLREDATTKRYKSYFDNWISTNAMDDNALCNRIRADGIDILVDLAGHTAGNRLGVFARKPAPVSVSWLGYASTTGLRSIDYLLIDETSAPQGSEHLFAETPWRLETPAYVYRPAEGMGAEGALPALARGFVTFGTLTRALRINDRTLGLWAQILSAVPRSHLVVDSFSFADPDACETLAARFEAKGISRERLQIGHHTPPWDVLRGIDIGLDCFPHNSGVTLFETLYMGSPYVTLASRPSVGRIGSSILEGVGHPEWIARSENEYLQIAVQLASDLPALAEIRSRLRNEMASRPIMDERGFAARVEAAYRRMFGIWESKHVPRGPADS